MIQHNDFLSDGGTHRQVSVRRFVRRAVSRTRSLANTFACMYSTVERGQLVGASYVGVVVMVRVVGLDF